MRSEIYSKLLGKNIGAMTVDSAKAAAILFSLIETCKAQNVNPYDWLRHALIKLPACETVEEYFL